MEKLTKNDFVTSITGLAGKIAAAKDPADKKALTVLLFSVEEDFNYFLIEKGEIKV